MAEKGALFVTLGLSATSFVKGLSTAEKAVAKSAKAFQSVGAELTKAITLPLAGIAAASIKVGADFQAGMMRVSQATGATGRDLQGLGELAKTMGLETVFSSTEAALAMQGLAKAGFQVQDMAMVLPAVLALASGEQISLAEATGAVDQVLDTFGLSAEDAAHAADVLTVASQGTEGGVGELSAALSGVSTVALSSGMSLDETVAVLRAFQDVGVPAAKAGTDLKMALLALKDPTDAGKDALHRLGIAVFGADGKMRPFRDIVADLGNTSATTGDFIDIFGKKAGPDMEALVRRGSGALADITQKIKDSGGAAQEAGAVGMAGFWGAVERLKGSAENLLIAISESGLLGGVESLTRGAAALVGVMGEIPSPILAVITGLAALAAGIGPVMYGIGKLTLLLSKGGALAVGLEVASKGFLALKVLVLSLFTIPTGLIIAAIAAGVLLIVRYWDDVKRAGKSLAEKLGINFQEIADDHSRMARDISGGVASVKTGLSQLSQGASLWQVAASSNFARAGSAVSNFATTTVAAFDGVKASAEGRMPAVSGAVQAASEKSGRELARLREHLRDGIDGMMEELDRLTPDVETDFGSSAAAFTRSFGHNLKLDAEAKLKYGLITQAAYDAERDMAEAGKFLSDTIDYAFEHGGIDEMVGEATLATINVVEAIEDNIERSKPGIFGRWEDLWGGIKSRLDGFQSGLAHDIAEAWVGAGSISEVFEDAAHRIKVAVLETIINAVLTQLVAKLTEIWNIIKTGLVGGGKPALPGAGGGSGAPPGGAGGIGGRVGLTGAASAPPPGIGGGLESFASGAAMIGVDTAKSTIANLLIKVAIQQGIKKFWGVMLQAGFQRIPSGGFWGWLGNLLQIGLPGVPGWTDPGEGGDYGGDDEGGGKPGFGGSSWGGGLWGGNKVVVNVGGSVMSERDLVQLIRQELIGIGRRTTGVLS